jgi:hypothetical protein
MRQPSGQYSPVHHLTTALFSFSCERKFMMMLTSYLDETGDSKDDKQKFNGMAGLVAPAENWEVFEQKWKAVLKTFGLPYIHMSEIRTLTRGWSEAKVEKLFGKLWKIIKSVKALPVGSTIPMDDYNPLKVQLKKYFRDPYYIAMQNCIQFTAELVEPVAIPTPDSPRVAMIFDDKVEFRNNAQQLYDAAIKKVGMGNLVDPPAFRNMRRVVPLQAADMIAYETYKEYDRVYYKRSGKARFGWDQIEGIYRSSGIAEIQIVRHNKFTLADWVTKAEAADRKATYWEKQRAKKRDKPKA